jgi:hypothetical protein
MVMSDVQRNLRRLEGMRGKEGKNTGNYQEQA